MFLLSPQSQRLCGDPDKQRVLALPTTYKNSEADKCLLRYFGTLRGTRTLDLLVRSQSLYPTELAARVSKNIKMLAVCTQIDLAVRSQSLYPTELTARVG